MHVWRHVLYRRCTRYRFLISRGILLEAARFLSRSCYGCHLPAVLSQIGSEFLDVDEVDLDASRNTMDDSLISKLLFRISSSTSSWLAPAASMFLYFATVSMEETAALLCVHPIVSSVWLLSFVVRMGSDDAKRVDGVSVSWLSLEIGLLCCVRVICEKEVFWRERTSRWGRESPYSSYQEEDAV